MILYDFSSVHKEFGKNIRLLLSTDYCLREIISFAYRRIEHESVTRW